MARVSLNADLTYFKSWASRQIKTDRLRPPPSDPSDLIDESDEGFMPSAR